MIKVLVVDDQIVVCEGLRVVLNAKPHIEVVDVAHNGVEAVEKVSALQPDLVLMDLKMPEMNGIQATRIITTRHPDMPVLILTTYDDDDEWVLEAVRARAKGYLLKDTDRRDLVAAIEGTIAGKTHIVPAVAEKPFTFIRVGEPLNEEMVSELSERELKVLQLLANGLTNAAIADRLHLAEGTVFNHVSNILAKLGVTDRAQATAFAWRHGLIMPIDKVKLVSKLWVLIYFVRRSSAWGIGSGFIAGFLCNSPFLGPYNNWVSLATGGVAGGIVGFVNGIILGFMTLQFPYPFDDKERYKQRVSNISMMITLIGGGVIFIGIEYFVLLSFPHALCIGLPASLFTALAVYFASEKAAGWYIRSHQPRQK